MSLRRNALFEIELLMVPSSRCQPEPGLYVPETDGPVRRTRSRTFWCSNKQQQVEVEFETEAFLGFPRVVGITRCSAFDQPEDIACGRHCLDTRFRRQWPYALPVAGTGGTRRA